ncbi:MAG TPA: hypothetical protein VFW23_13980 [Tepidisphaeraceae bacterium]|nr:hypothetical protein [Tepidisphaeraceae bacterium]
MMQPIPLSKPMTPELARAIYACKRFKMIDKLSNFPISDGDAELIRKMSEPGSNIGKPSLRAGPAKRRRIPVRHAITEAQARSIYAVIMAGCDAPERRDPDDFIKYMTVLHRASAPFGVAEWRFEGCLGRGGKLHFEQNEIWISYYPEDQTPERDAAIDRTMRALAVLMEKA